MMPPDQRKNQDGVRLDKWLKVSRLIKRRTVAQAACDAGCVQINGRAAKPASAVRPGDHLRIDLGRRLLAIEVLDVPAGAVSAIRAGELYRVMAEIGFDGEASRSAEAE